MTAIDTAKRPAARIRGLRVAYRTRRGSVQALQGVDVTVRRGETVAVVGESGSGKSTLTHALLGITPGNATVSADTLDIAGASVLQASDSQWEKIRGHRVGYIPQDPGVALNPLLSIGAHFAETFAVLRPHLPAASHADYAIEALERVGLSEPERRLRQRPWMLSGGMRQRVLIALALVGAPDLIIADEPTSALDVTIQRKVLDLIDEVRQTSGSGLLLITHDLAVALDRADRIVVMHGGEIVEQGTRDEILHSAAHEYTRQLLRDSLRVVEVDRTDHQIGDSEAIAVAGVTKSFGKAADRQRVLQQIDLIARSGETLALIGESGSGKSTLARIVMGLERADDGEVRVSGTPRASSRARDLAGRIQFVHQNPFTSLDPRWSVERIVTEPLAAARRVSRRERARAAADALEQVGLGSEFATRRPGELSGGQRQRVAIARALASGADVIVLDEAVSALDVTVQSQILTLLARLQREHGLTYLFITHDLAVVEAFADRVAVIADGRIVELNDTAAVFESPESDEARALLEAIPGRDLRSERSAA